MKNTEAMLFHKLYMTYTTLAVYLLYIPFHSLLYPLCIISKVNFKSVLCYQ